MLSGGTTIPLTRTYDPLNPVDTVWAMGTESRQRSTVHYNPEYPQPITPTGDYSADNS
jgi:hypothetical protein